MAYELVTVPAARRALKKLPLAVRKHLIDAIQPLIENPYLGDQLQSSWRFLRSFHTVYRRTHYRIAYEIDKKNQRVIIRSAASRENFYKELRRLKLKPLTQ
jgi:mRNA-degrading endonuclease RelE of RelBE toxin-antitoxin system